MARTKRFRPGKSGAKSKPQAAPKKGIPAAPPAPGPIQSKLGGFTTPELEEIEAVSEKFARVQDFVKAEKKKLQDLFDDGEAKVIEVMQKYNREALVIGGYTIQIVKTTKAKVKGNPPPKSETASRDHEDDEKEPENSAHSHAERLRREDAEKGDDTTIEISTRGGSVTVTPEQMKKMAKTAGKVAQEMASE
jgi:hypothetical protein